MIIYTEVKCCDLSYSYHVFFNTLELLSLLMVFAKNSNVCRILSQKLTNLNSVFNLDLSYILSLKWIPEKCPVCRLNLY